MKTEHQLNTKIDNAIKVIKEEKKELQKLLREIEKKGLITTEKIKQENKKISNPQMLHDIRFNKSIRRIKENTEFITEFRQKNLFTPHFLNLSAIPVNLGLNKKQEIKKQIENKKIWNVDNESFLLQPFKEEIKKKIKNKIKTKAHKIKEFLKILENEIYDVIKEGGETKKVLNEKGKFWSLAITLTPDKEELKNILEILVTTDFQKVKNEDPKTFKKIEEEFGKKTATTLLKHIKLFKEIDTENLNLIQPIKTSIVLFNQYLSKIERETLKEFYKEENFNDKYIEFLQEIKDIKKYFNLRADLTDAQKILTFSFIQEVKEHIRTSKKIQPITLMNTSEVGTGKTFTIPFVTLALAVEYLKKYNKKSTFLIITEANLLLETKQKLIKEVGLKKYMVEIIENNNLLTFSPKPWKYYLISKNRISKLEKDTVKAFAKLLKNKGLLIHTILDESSYLKNTTSITSIAYKNLKSKLTKEKVMGFEMQMSATPISNDTSDAIYCVNPNKIVLKKLGKQGLSSLNLYYKNDFEWEELTLRETLKLASLSQDCLVKTKRKTATEPKAAALLCMNSVMFPVIPKEKEEEKKEKNNEKKKEEPTQTQLQASKLGISLARKKNELMHSGTKSKKALVEAVASATKLSNFKGIDRILNTNIDTSVQTNAIVLKTNILEAATFHEIIVNSRITANFQKFGFLSKLLRQLQVEIPTVEEEKKEIRKFLLMQILYDLEKIKVTTNKKRDKNSMEIYTIDKKEFIKAIKEILSSDNIEEFIIKEIDPAIYLKTTNLENQLKSNINNKTKKEIENQLKKLKETKKELIETIMPINETNLKKVISEDLKEIRAEKREKIKIKPLSLHSYKNFIEKIEIDLKSETKLEIPLKNPTIHQQIFNEAEGDLTVYSALFQASENLELPIISKHLKRAARKIKNILEENGISVKDYNIDEMVKIITEKGSTTINTIRETKRFANSHNIPILAVTSYKNTVEKLKNDNDMIITGQVKQEKRKNIIDQSNKIENNKNVIATAQSILKGISLYYLPYGIMPETPKNAEFRTQIAGRLRNLFEHHIQTVKTAKKDPDKQKHLKILEKNQKFFDIISTEVMLAFPSIQQSKNILIEMTKFASQHQEITGIEMEDSISESDHNDKYTFKKHQVEKFSEEIAKRKVKEIIKILNGKTEITFEELKTAIDKHIKQTTEKNLKKTTIYHLIKEKE
ncbi:hypothetical protein [Persephonella sp. KM09-Lau-8]|uniref:hypothetical protein n=1 Tax=Persephonella sp. KM09-Lau-8 TaxID=1158345 RepID=UPI000495DF49|nr:hypothetical protein [Persephonella sp. KM09-Lau-8]